MDFEQAIKSRYSCRKFLDREVPRTTIEKILTLSQHTASWSNVQPWRVLVAGGGAAKKFSAALVEHIEKGGRPNPDFAFPAEYQDVEKNRRRACGLQLYQAVNISREDEARKRDQFLENYRLFNAPHVVLITTPRYLGFYGALDCGLYVNSFMLAAQSLGVATIAQAAIAHYSDFVRQYFSIGDERQLICGISFGFEDKEHAINQYRTERASLNDVVMWAD